MIPHLFFYRWRSWDSCGCVSCCTLPGPAEVLRHRERPPSPSGRDVNAPRSPSHLRVSPTSPIVPYARKKQRTPRHSPLCGPLRYLRPTAAPVRLTPRGISVRMPPVTIAAAWAWATSAPMAIPVVAHGDSSTAPPATATFWRRMAPSFMANG